MATKPRDSTDRRSSGGGGDLQGASSSIELRDSPGAEEWDALADRVGAAPWLRPGWIIAWWRAFGRGRLEVGTVRRAGVLTAVCPLERRGGVLRAPANYHTPWFDVLADDDTAHAELVGAWLAQPARRVQFAFLLPGGADRVRAAAWRAGHRVVRRTLERSPYVDLSGSYEAFERELPGKARRDLRRRQRRLAERGRVELTVHDGREGLSDLLHEGFGVEAAGWKGQRGTAIASQPATLRFYTDIAHWAAARGELRLAFLRLDGRCLAFDLVIEHDRRHYLLKTGYDPAYRELAPGRVLRAHMLARAFREDLRSYEFLGADDPWKREWTSTVRERQLVQAFARSAAGALEWMAFAHGRPAAKRALARLGR